MKFVELKSPPQPSQREGDANTQARANGKVLPFGEDLGGAGFKVFDDAEIVVGICANGCASYSRK